jgi:CheY-like chemotaxis protein
MQFVNIDPELSVRLTAIAKQCRQIVRDAWRPDECRYLCEEVDRLAARAQAAGFIDLSEGLLGFGVYVSSFADDGLQPKPEQLQQVAALVDAIEDALERYLGGVEVIALAPRGRAAPLADPAIVFFGRNAEHLAILENCFTPLGYRVRAFTALADVEAAVTADVALAVIVGEDTLQEWATGRRASETGAGSARVPLAVLSSHDLLQVRLAAMRCSAEVVFILPEDQGRIARRLAGLIADRTEPYRVLIVDDDKSMRIFCASVLRHNNLNARAVATPEEALLALHDFSPDVILVDLYMPQLSGFELLALFRAHPRTAFTPVVLLSGDSDTEKRFDALHIGGDDYLSKPIRPRHLVAAVTSRARRARWMRRELLA